MVAPLLAGNKTLRSAQLGCFTELVKEEVVTRAQEALSAPHVPVLVRQVNVPLLRLKRENTREPRPYVTLLEAFLN